MDNNVVARKMSNIIDNKYISDASHCKDVNSWYCEDFLLDMYAEKDWDNYPEIRDEVLGVVGSCHYVSPEEVAVYKLDPLANVYCENLKNSKTGLIGINALDEVSEYIGEDFDRLSDIYRKQLRKK